jgi:hypothetical protein
MKLIALDIDGTLGAFPEFSGIYGRLTSTLSQVMFNHILDQNPTYLRTRILDILTFLKHNKQQKRCQVVLYTNNQGSVEWVRCIKRYFEKKLEYPLFDSVILAYKIGDTRVEPLRTTHAKCHRDLVACARIPKNMPIFFVDDQYHPDMIHPNITYFKIRPYNGDTDFESSSVLMTHLVKFLT